MRWLVGKERELVESGNVYHETVSKDELEDLIWKNIVTEYDKYRICSLIEKQPQTVSTIAKKLHMPTDEVFRYLALLEAQGLITLQNIKNNAPRYTLAKQPEAVA
jgi:DNA-binding transcriptional regulator LsrR (DeoR family)